MGIQRQKFVKDNNTGNQRWGIEKHILFMEKTLKKAK